MIFFIVIIFIVLQLPFEPEYYKLKTGIPNSDMKSVLNTIFNMDNMDRLSQIENPERQERIIIAERHSYSQIKYYLENHSEFSRKNRGEIRNYKISMVQRMREINARNFFNSRGPVWIVNSDPRDINKSDKYLVKSNIMFQQIFKENQNELICYLPHTLSNILTFNNKNGFKGISPISEMAIKSEMRSGKEVLVARSKGKNTFLEFPEIQYPKDRFLSISARMESPTQTDLCIFYMTESDKQYTQSKSVCIWIDYGQNNLNAIINDKNIYGKILLSPGKASGDYIISEISIDAVDR
jgi:hypothetical protein